MEELLERLGQNLVWRIGRPPEEEVLVVRVGLASATPRFKDLPPLTNPSEEELLRLYRAGRIRVEWVE